MIEQWIATLFEQCGLGQITKPITPVSGGFMHRMYQVSTEEKDYAVKHLNSEVMAREGAVANFDRADRLEEYLKNGGIPMVPALVLNGKKRQFIDGQYFYVFLWQEGKITDWNNITCEQCYAAGNIQGRIHSLNFMDESKESQAGIDRNKALEAMLPAGESEESQAGIDRNKALEAMLPAGESEESQVGIDRNKAPEAILPVGESEESQAGIDRNKAQEAKVSTGEIGESQAGIDWDEYVKVGKQIDSEIATLLSENLQLLRYADRERAKATRFLPKLCCICDEDMDPKNVMWNHGKPFVIDLECLDFGNPISHVLQLSLQWSGITTCNLKTPLIKAFFEGYLHAYDNGFRDYESVFGLAYTWVEWLEYNLRRALQTSIDESERIMGVREVKNTIHRIQYIYEKEIEIKKVFGEIRNQHEMLDV